MLDDELGLFEFLDEFLCNDTDDASIDVSSSCNQTNTKRRTLTSKRATLDKTIQIAQDDVRRNFSKLYEDALNSHIPSALTEVLNTIACSELHSTVVFPKGNPSGVSYFDITGMTKFSEFMHLWLYTGPDTMYFVHDSQITGFEDGTSVIVHKFTITGTRLRTLAVEVTDPDTNETRKVQICNLNPASAGVETIEKDSENPRLSPRLLGPIQFVATGNVSNKFDSFKKQRTNATLGSFVEYEPFSEINLRPQDRSSRRKHPKATTTTTTDSVTAQSSSSVNDIDNEHLMATLPKSETFPSDKVLFLNNDTKLTFGRELPKPDKMSLKGVHKSFLNVENKIHTIHMLLTHMK